MKDMLKKYGVLLFISIAALCITLVAGIKGSKDDALYNKVSFDVKNNMNNDGVKIWKNNYIAYIFLPAYAERDSVTFADNEFDIKLKLGSNTYENGDKIKNLELDKEYDAELSHNSKREKFKLTFYQANDTATVYIDTESQSLYKINKDKDNKETGSMKIIDRNGKINFENDIEYISGRGNYSWMWGDKKSYNIKLNDSTDILNLGASDKWCINANCFDKSSLKNKMIYDFAKELGMPYTPDTAYADVYFNGEYAGIYLFSEKVNVEKNRVNIHDLQAENDLLNGTDYHDVMIEYNNKRGYKAENEPSKMDGGYLMELLPYDREYTSGFFTRNNNVLISIDSPKYTTLNELEYISNYVSDFEEAINAKNGRNSQDIYYMEYIDAISWADKMIIEELFSNWDMDYASQFFYKDTDDNKLHAGPVWDYDLSCGHVDGMYTSKTDTNVLFINEHHFGMHGWWYERLYSHGDFKKLMAERFQKEFYPRIPGLVGMVLPGLNEQIEQSTVMDSLRWGYEKDENLDTLSEYVNGKTQYLYDLWINNETYHKVTMVYDVYGEKNYYIVGVKDGEILKDYPEVDVGDGEFLGWYVDDKPYSVNAIVKDDLTLVAKVQQNTSPKSQMAKVIYAVKENMEIIPIVIFVLLIPVMIIYEKKRG